MKDSKENIEIFPFRFGDSAKMNSALEIRRLVFVIEQNVPPDLEYDGEDNHCNQYLLYLDNIPVATARCRTTEKGIKLERFAVLKEFRSQGVGRILLDYIINETDKNNLLYLHSQESAMSFYSRNGFVKCGDAFYEASIKHYEMMLVRL